MTRPYRIAFVSAGITAALLLAFGAQAQLMRGHNSNAPVSFSADRIEVQDRADRVVVSGNVQVTQENLTLTAARMTVAYRNADGIQIDRIDASGSVRITRGQDRATSDVAIYDLNAKIITLVGHVTLNQNGNRLSGNRMVMDLDSGRSAVDGQGGRVSGTFTVPQRK